MESVSGPIQRGATLAVVSITFFFWTAATGAVDVLGAESYPDGPATLETDTCHAELSHLVETDQSVEVRGVASSGSLLFGNDDRADALGIRLSERCSETEI